jgi:hypothetical protein
MATATEAAVGWLADRPRKPKCSRNQPQTASPRDIRLLPDRRELGLLDSASSIIAVSGRLAAGARGMRERPVLLDFRPFGISC